MRATSKLLALALTAALQPAMADAVAVSFDDLSTTNPLVGIQLGDRYKSNGVQFTGSAWGVVSSSCNSDGWAFVTHGTGCGALLLANDANGGLTTADKTFTLNFAEGFIAGSSFFYSALSGSGISITLFDGLNGTGNSTELSGFNTGNCGVSGATFCNWSQFNITNLKGVAYSMVVSAQDQTFMLDDLNLVKAASAPGTVPEPASIALALGALGALGWSRKRAAR
jgi:hypothetical protein